MTPDEIIALAIKLMRERNYCEIATNRMLLKIKEKPDWTMQELENLIIGRK